MKLRNLFSADGTFRSWVRRVARTCAARPDVVVLQLSRRIEVMERVQALPENTIENALKVIRLLAPSRFEGVQLDRFGSPFDGGYVLPSRLVAGSAGVISLGVGDNNDADVHLAKLGLPVHSWDHTVQGLPSRHRSIHFHRLGVGFGDEKLRTLDAVTVESFPEVSTGLILMMDIEGAEWDALLACHEETLDRFDVLAVELHDLGNVLTGDTRALQVLTRLRNRFVPIAVHVNNHCATWPIEGTVLPDCVEVTWVRGELLSGVGAPGNAPKTLFAPCCPDIPEVVVRDWDV